MRPLLAKELRALTPLGVLAFLLISGDVIYRPLTERLDVSTWSSISAIEASESGSMAFLFGLLAFFVAYSAFPREHDEGTIEWLSSLPVTRRSIFGAKVLAGATVLVTFVLLGQVTNWLLQAANTESLGGTQFRLDVALTAGFLQSAFVVIAYCHGLLASVMRRFGLLPYALLVWLVLALEEIDPSLGWTSPAELCRFAYEGQRLTIPWLAVSVHSALALVALALAYGAWMGPFERAREALAPKREGRSIATTVGLGCGTAVVVVVLLGLLVFVAVRDADPTALSGNDTGVTWQTADVRTDRYAFTYPTNLRSRAMRLVAAADEIGAGVQRTVGAEEPVSITVDLAETSAHHEGIAAGTRIRMPIVGHDDERRHRYVLAHESTHVYQGRESDRRLMTNGAVTRFFVEGSADWVAFEVVPGLDAERRQSRLVAAASWERHRLALEDVLDDASLRARFDTTLVYSLGETWTEAIARACGREAVGGVMRAMGREGAPQDLPAIALWQDTLQAAGCDEASVRVEWERLLGAVLLEDRAAIDAIPRAGASVTGHEGGETIVTATLDRPSPPGATWTLRARRDRAASDAEMSGATGELVDPTHVRFSIPDAMTFPRFDLAVCVVPDGGNWTFCEPWQSG